MTPAKERARDIAEKIFRDYRWVVGDKKLIEDIVEALDTCREKTLREAASAIENYIPKPFTIAGILERLLSVQIVNQLIPQKDPSPTKERGHDQ